MLPRKLATGLPRVVALGLAIASLAGAACGGGPRAATADLVAIRQPTPDPTLDAVVRDLPRALAGVIVPTPTPTPPVLSAPAPKPKPATPVPTARPPAKQIPPTATLTKPRP
jgi:hypothetical protein